MSQRQKIKLLLEVEFDFYEGEMPSREHPGEPASYDIHSIWLGGKKIDPCMEAWELATEALKELRKWGDE